MDMDDLPLESRLSTTSVLGKLDGEINKMKISFDTQVGLQRMAAEAAMSMNEYVRMVLDCHVHGVDHIANLAAQRIRLVVGKGAQR